MRGEWFDGIDFSGLGDEDTGDAQPAEAPEPTLREKLEKFAAHMDERFSPEGIVVIAVAPRGGQGEREYSYYYSGMWWDDAVNAMEWVKFSILSDMRGPKGGE